MKQKLQTVQSLKHSLNLSHIMKQSLDILKLNSSDIMELITEVTNNNPLIEYTPPSDMEQLVPNFPLIKKIIER